MILMVNFFVIGLAYICCTISEFQRTVRRRRTLHRIGQMVLHTWVPVGRPHRPEVVAPVLAEVRQGWVRPVVVVVSVVVVGPVADRSRLRWT